MTYEVVIFKPGISGFHKKTGQPIPFEPMVDTFEAACGTEAMGIASEIYRKTGLGYSGHFNVGRVG